MTITCRTCQEDIEVTEDEIQDVRENGEMQIFCPHGCLNTLTKEHVSQ